MNLNWLFGQRLSRNNQWLNPEILVIRSVTTDLDTVREVAKRIDERFSSSKASFWVQDPNAVSYQRREVPADQLQSISAADRGRLYIETSSSELGNMRVELRQKSRPVITMVPNEPDFMDLIANILLDSGRPLVRWARLVRYTLALPFLSLLAAWIWLSVTEFVSLPAQLFGWLIVAFALAGTIAMMRRPFIKLELSYPGHRIRNETRIETYARRADTHKNIKVALITAPITIVATLLVGLITGFLHPQV